MPLLLNRSAGAGRHHHPPFGSGSRDASRAPIRLYELPPRLTPRRLGDYSAVAPADALAGLRRLARPLAGLRVLHLSAGPFGSAVADALAALVPLQRELGLEVEWRVLRAHGDAAVLGSWSTIYEELSGGIAGSSAAVDVGHPFDTTRLSRLWDVIVLHDPQLIGLPGLRPGEGGADWLWHCHLDLRTASPTRWPEVYRGLSGFAAVLFAHEAFSPGQLGLPRVIMPEPVLDPCSPRNAPLAAPLLPTLMRQLGIDPERPIVGQFAPNGHRYATLAALGAYWLARHDVPGLQLVLADVSAASPETLPSAGTPPETAEILRAAARDGDVHLLTPLGGLTATHINALERSVDVALQMAVPRGWSQGLLECQWKGKPAVVGRYGQLAEQAGWGSYGAVVDGAPDAAERIVDLLRQPERAGRIGAAARRSVLEGHLILAQVAAYLRLFQQLAEKRTIGTGGEPG
ncbi:MAG TPA: hypothetical protein VMV93_15050 [Chloroflexota bacterium]|nr:hypothetical protein [Chloroflexota bacterium]